MIGFLIIGLLLISSSISTKVEEGDSNIYKYAVQAVKELKDRQLAERNGIHHSTDKVEKPKSVCYDELGCFDRFGTFKNLKLLPEPPETVNTQFLLYTRKNPETPQFLSYKKPDTVLNSNIDPKLPLKFITHGFGGKNNLTWVLEMKTAFLKKEELNVIVIDWSLGARVPYYTQATVNTELVGAEAAVLYYFIKENLGIQEKDLHVIGFSLGAHVAGFVGKRMQDLGETRPARITGLDPASPLFEDETGEVHLYKDDADYVDVVHTNADAIYLGGVGIEKPIGHVDYYPNGGKRQPGCGSTLVGLLKDIFKNERERACNHERAVHLFTDSILNDSPCEYTSFRCSNYSDFQLGKCISCSGQCGRMGYQSQGSGTYYLMTKEKPPFCAALVKLKVKFAPTVKKTYGSIIITFTGKSGKKENVTITEDTDEKLSPGQEKTAARLMSDAMSDLESVQVLYVRYGGFMGFSKGSKTFGLTSLTITDSANNFIFKSCNEPAITLNHDEYHTLNQTDEDC